MDPRNKPGELLPGFGTGDMIIVTLLVSLGLFGLAMAVREAYRRSASP